MSLHRRRLPHPRVRDWKSNKARSPTPIPSPAEPDDDCNLCNPDLEPLPPMLAVSPFNRRALISTTKEPSIHTDRRFHRENKSVDSVIVSQAPSAQKRTLWSSSSALADPLDTRPSSDSSSEGYQYQEDRSPDGEQSDTMMSSPSPIVPSMAIDASIQIFPFGMPASIPASSGKEPAADRFLLAHQVRRISMHRGLSQQNLQRFENEGRDGEESTPNEEEHAPRNGVTMEISFQEPVANVEVVRQRKVRALSKRRTLIARRHKVSPSPRPDSRLLPRSNRTLIKNALTRVCLAGGATVLERALALEALENSYSDWFIILLREQRHKFRALYNVESNVEGAPPALIKIFGDGPQQLGMDAISSFYKYDSANKCFEELLSHHLTATTDAVSAVSRKFVARSTES